MPDPQKLKGLIYMEIIMDLNVMDLFICILLFTPLIYGIYLIIKGIVYYRSAEQREATVADITDLEGARNGDVYYSFSVDIEDDGEIFNVPMEVSFRVKRIEHALKKGDKITVWYLKKYKKCVGKRGTLIMSGVYLVALVAIVVAICVFSILFVQY